MYIECGLCGGQGEIKEYGEKWPCPCCMEPQAKESEQEKTTKFYSINSNTTDVWLTPPDLVAKLGKFDLDPCSPNNLQWKLADKFYSLENGEDGLSLPWNGRIWLNPPYSNWGKFLEKLKKHGNGIALIFARTETRAFFDHIWNDADSILFIKKRVKFIRADGSPGGSSTAPSVLIAYGRENTAAIENSGIEGKLIKLKV